MNVAVPFRVDARGRTAEADDPEHVRRLIETVLFTSPGERVNRPDLGSGLLQLAFAPSSPELATAVRFLVQGALQKWLGELITVEAVEVEGDDETLRVAVRYVLRRTGERRDERFERAAPP